MDSVTSNDLRRAIRQKFAWPGGYEIFGIADDGGALCCDCMWREYYQIAYSRRYRINDGWRIVAVENTSNCDGGVSCSHCGKVIQEESEQS